MVLSKYALPNTPLLADAYEPGKANGQVAFDWGVGVTLSALNAAAKHSKEFIPTLQAYADATRSYWNTTPPVAGYNVLPNSRGMDRYYDDNEWMVLALADTYDVPQRPQISPLGQRCPPVRAKW